MDRSLDVSIRLQPLVQWMGAQGLASADLEMKGDLLIVRHTPSQRARLLADGDLRQQLLDQAKASGFSRVALDLSFGERGILGRVGNGSTALTIFDPS